MAKEMDERKAYVNLMKKQRGFVHELHKVLVAEDFEFIKKYNELSEIAYTKPRLLDRRTKELIFVAILATQLSSIDHIKMHIEAAMKAGATKEEILQTLELTFIPAGGVSFMRGFDAWKEVVSPQKIEPDG